jgi:uncharacterized protein
MELMSSRDFEVTKEEQDILLAVAKKAVFYGIKNNQAITIKAEEFPDRLQEIRATFVTLKKLGELRGCCGTMYASEALVASVASSAHAAAFLDNRFNPVSEPELGQIKFHISVLSPLEPIAFTDQEDLLSKIRPGIDGLYFEDGFSRGCFLPVMWEQLPDPRVFLSHLKIKSGLPMDYWSDTIRVSRYTAQLFPPED